MLRWIKRIALGLVLAAVVATLAWAMWPKPVPVDVAAVARGPLTVTVDEDGRARVEDRYLVTAPLAGTLARIELRAGDPVTAGAVVARVAPLPAPLLDPRTRAELAGRRDIAHAQLRQASSTVDRARVASDFAERELERAHTLTHREAMPASELDRAQLAAELAERDLVSARFAATVATAEAETADRMLARVGNAAAGQDVDVASPIDGQVLRVVAESEGVVGPGTPLVELGDPARLEIVVDVLTADAVAIAPGAPVSVEGWGGPPLAGRVRRVEPSATTRVSALGVEEQRVDVIVDLVGPRDAWRGLGDGWRVEVRITTWHADDVLAVPLGAIIRAGDAWAVFVVEGGRVHRRTVELGHRNRALAEVTAGLAAGDRVVLHPGERVVDGARVVAR
ncbi:MAG TPA: efflux RND transporter periplasmic adaptor subunit [Kofleriaceae bacterium]|nr:efflux RND transporter periplasmic adaptor subunit [Kofleriaceae bacterium]